MPRQRSVEFEFDKHSLNLPEGCGKHNETHIPSDHDYIASVARPVCRTCGLEREAHLTANRAKRKQRELSDRIGAELWECAQCGETVPAVETHRLMRTVNGTVVQERVCIIDCVPTGSGAYRRIAVAYASGRLNADEYEVALAELGVKS